MSRPNPPDYLNASLRAMTPTVVGCAIGLLLAGKLGRPTQKVTAASLLGIGVLLATPALTGLVSNAVVGPGSTRGARRRLESIRTDSGFPDEADIY
jgi:hypothetical protein